MSGEFLKDLLDKMPFWFYHAAGAVVLIALCFFFWFSFSGLRGLKKVISAVNGREDRIKELQDKLDRMKEVKQQYFDKAEQATGALFNVRSFIDALNEIRTETNPQTKIQESMALIQQILNQLASNMKVTAGDEHRCGMWLLDDATNQLVLRVGSSGFPRSYIDHRMLNVNDSIAGRAFTKKLTVNCSDVTADTDWTPSPDRTTVHYRALICIPLEGYGILSIDGKYVMSEESELIGEVYASLIEAAVMEYEEGFTRDSFDHILEGKGVDLLEENG
jgi:hypothetical protein